LAYRAIGIPEPSKLETGREKRTAPRVGLSEKKGSSRALELQPETLGFALGSGSVRGGQRLYVAFLGVYAIQLIKSCLRSKLPPFGTT
jgi:hypothetical protein